MFKLETKRLTLRNFTKDDLEFYINLRNDAKFKRFYSESDISQSKSKSLLNMFISDSNEQPRRRYQLAITIGNKELIGSCGVRIEEGKVASVGCELGRKYQTSGYAYEASLEIINFAFDELNISRIYAETVSENKPAIKLCEKLGMKVKSELTNEKYFKGRWWNTLILEMENNSV